MIPLKVHVLSIYCSDVPVSMNYSWCSFLLIIYGSRLSRQMAVFTEN